jgi:hypothetical protein
MVGGFFTGQKVLITYREGGSVYGTYFFLQIHYCRSGAYKLIGQSRKRTALENEQMNNWRDQGKWTVEVLGGQVGIRYMSVTGQTNFYPVNGSPQDDKWVAEGVSAIRQGPAQCQ